MSEHDDLLVEIGTEELPPKALPSLIAAFSDAMSSGLEEARLSFSKVRPFGSPRRLAVVVEDLSTAQPDRVVEQKGPPVRVAFDDEGKPTAAAEAFARKCGVELDALQRVETEKGEWLSYRAEETGERAAELLPDIIGHALAQLPVPRPMRWGAGDIEFVRPVHWAVVTLGNHQVEGTILGIAIGSRSRGHRFLAPDELDVSAASYASTLEAEGYVIADFAERRQRVEASVREAAGDAGGVAVASEALLDEVTALVEWPVALVGRFEDSYLALPREVITAVLTNHQRYFPVAGDDGQLLPAFVTVSNLVSKDPEQVRAGNERVIRPRLADADFFYTSDRATALADRRDALDNVVYQRGLGSLGEKSERVRKLAVGIADGLGIDATATGRAALLAKCDLVTNMVGEFPELQGIMGRYYAIADGEADDVASAIAEHYQPRHAGDSVPTSDVGSVVALADKIDTLSGSFALGKKPSGNRDPFGLRRAALGVVRILVERKLDVDLLALIADSLSEQPVDAASDVAEEIYDYIVDRMRGYAMEQREITSEMFDAVRARSPSSLVDFQARLDAVATFVAHPAANQLAAANKRIANILRQADSATVTVLDAALLSETAEQSLHDALVTAQADVAPLLKARSYADTLTRLAALQEPVDVFFDEVMVMADDARVRENRLGLLASLREQFLEVADISRLSVK